MLAVEDGKRVPVEQRKIVLRYARGQEIVTTLDRPEGGDIIQDYGRSRQRSSGGGGRREACAYETGGCSRCLLNARACGRTMGKIRIELELSYRNSKGFPEEDKMMD